MNVVIFGASGMSEGDYRRVTVDFAVAAAEVLVNKSPDPCGTRRCP